MPMQNKPDKFRRIQWPTIHISYLIEKLQRIIDGNMIFHHAILEEIERWKVHQDESKVI
jgi:hypothetical protein